MLHSPFARLIPFIACVCLAAILLGYAVRWRGERGVFFPTVSDVSASTPLLPWGAATTSLFWSDDRVTQISLTAPRTSDGRIVMGNPLFLYGTTMAFGNRISWKVDDDVGTEIAFGYVDVHSPDAGIPGPFSITAFYGVTPKTRYGVFRVFEASAKDGAPIHVVEIPVFFPWIDNGS